MKRHIEDEKLRTVKDGAKALGICEETERRRVRSGKLGHLRLGPRLILFTQEDVGGFLERKMDE